MLKLLLRSLYNTFWSIDVLGSALTFGAKGETISARLYGQALKPGAAGFPAKLGQKGLDGLVYGVFGEKNHTKVAYDSYVAAKVALGNS